MIRLVLLTGAAMMAAPLGAQTVAVPVAPAPVTDATPAAPTPMPMATEALPASAPEMAQAAEPAAKAAAVASVVKAEFPAYDKDNDGKLSSTEFGAWMVALKTVNDPATKADSPATKSWIGRAFASADADKDRAVTEAELNGFLAQG